MSKNQPVMSGYIVRGDYVPPPLPLSHLKCSPAAFTDVFSLSSMISLTTAFYVHFVVNILFCAPVLFMGLPGFVSLLTDGKITNPDGFLMHLLGIDFAKNIFIGATTYVGAICKDPVSQQQQAYAHMLCLVCIFAVQFITPNASPNNIMGMPPPVIMYMGLTGTAYSLASFMGKKTKTK